MKLETFFEKFDQLADGPNAVAKMRGLVLQLAVQGKKDYLEEGGLVINPITPRNVIKEAFVARLLEDAQLWIDMMLHRNLLSHTYDLKVFEVVLQAVAQRYFPALARLHGFFMMRRGEG